MTGAADDPVAVADEQIANWKRQRVAAQTAWRMLTDDPYPGGGWERVRAWMIGWLHDNEPQELRRAA